MHATTPPLGIADLENVYDWLAKAIDAAGPERTDVFLVKLALLHAQALGDVDTVRRHIDIALKDL